MSNLQPGDVLSYSAGSSQTGPDGYRRIRPGGSLLEALQQRWPAVLQGFAGAVPMVINAYPASLGRFDFGVLVDTYLSFKTGSRALQLAEREEMPVILPSQPLLLGELFVRHRQAGFPWPRTLLAITGGYPMPLSLERTLRVLCQSKRFHLLHGYGVAEVESGALLAMERNEAGELVYYLRDPAVEIIIDEGRLLMSARRSDGSYAIERFDTGDRARETGDGGYLIENAPRRVDPAILARLEGWTEDDWRRRTGYVQRTDDGIIKQLREGVDPAGDEELGFYRYGERFGFSWLNKARWGR